MKRHAAVRSDAVVADEGVIPTVEKDGGGQTPSLTRIPASRLRTSVHASAFFRARCRVARRRLPRPEGTLWPPFSFGRRGARAESANLGGEFDRNTARPRRRLNRKYMSIARRRFCRGLLALRARRQDNDAILITDPAVVDAFEGNFDRIWARAQNIGALD